MSIQITANIGELTVEQRTSLAEFITKFPFTPSLLNPADILSQFPPEVQQNPFAQCTADADLLKTAPEVMPEHSFQILDASEHPQFVQQQELKETIAAPVTTNPAEVDSAGLPWDSRIHSESKAKVADGTWRKRRGADPAIVAQVENELRQLMSIPTVSAAQALLASPFIKSIVIPTQATAPIPAAPAPIPAQYTDYISMIGRASAAIQVGKITPADTNAIVNKHGVAALPLLANRLDLVPAIAAEIDALIASKSA